MALPSGSSNPPAPKTGAGPHAPAFSLLATPPDDRMRVEAESVLFAELLDGADVRDTPAIFILGSPRTGSTLFYQCLVHYLRLPYFSNLANQISPNQPVLLAPAHRQIQSRIDIQFTSAYGKTDGAWQPSEASAVMRHWFGGEHPSQLASATFLPEKVDHMVRTLAAMHRVFGAPVVIKNAWNCFRIAAIAQAMPRAYFLWIRRDLVASALSDLAARYAVKGDPNQWNSATPANVASLRQLPHWAQVVENQFEYARAISGDLTEHASDRHAIVWYESFLRQPAEMIEDIAQKMPSLHHNQDRLPLTLTKVARSPRPYPESDEVNLHRYIVEHDARLSALRHKAA